MEKSEQQETTNNSEEFQKLIVEFTIALLEVCPEFENKLESNLQSIKNNTGSKENFDYVYKYCQSVYPSNIFHIMGKNNEIFEDDSINCFFLPNIDFKIVWNTEGVSETSKETIWKYLQLILFTIVGNMSNISSFGDTAKLFEMIDEDELKEKLQETFDNMEKMFEKNNENENENEKEGEPSNDRGFNMPNVDNIHDHLKGLMDGKLGKLAVEIAEETAQELNFDEENPNSAKDVFQSMMKNPGKLMGIANKIGSKIETKMKSGEINEQELMKEASEMFSKMKNTPGMGDIEKILKSMGGMGKNSKVNMNAMQAHMDRNIRMATVKERAIKKAAEKKEKMRLEQEKQKEREKLPDNVDVEKLIKELEEMDQKKFTAGEKPQQSQRPKKKKKKGKK
jgi:hypothetical protein